MFYTFSQPTAIATYETMLQLLNHVDVRLKVRGELKERVGGTMAEMRESFTLQSGLQYLPKVCMEAMRLEPPVKTSKMYEITEEIRLYDIAKPVIFPKGTKFLLNLVAINRDVKDRKESIKFAPELSNIDNKRSVESD